MLVDIGWLCGNWQMIINLLNWVVIDWFDLGGGVVMLEVVVNLGLLVDVVWFMNNLLYVEWIEYDGWSKQVLEGMV